MQLHLHNFASKDPPFIHRKTLHVLVDIVDNVAFVIAVVIDVSQS
jgi:hypothetical protein